jgi:Zn-dependent peptidase ImmA (M78 family)
MYPKLICKKVNKSTGEQYPTKKEIASFVNRLLNDYCKILNRSLDNIDHDEFISKYLNIDIQYQRLSLNKSILGVTIQEDGFIETYNEDSSTKIVFAKKGDIFIDPEACGCPQRELFTIYHELKHYLFDLDKDFKVDKIVDDNEMINGNFIVKTNYSWAEYFANYFAACAVLSRRRLKKLYYEKHQKYFNSYHTKMCEKRIGFLRSIIKEISDETGASKSAIAIRLKELNLITDKNFSLLNYKFGKEAVMLFRYNNGGYKET